jgi:hypothetical protein
MFGRAGPPQRGQAGSGGSARIVAASTRTSTPSAGQLPAGQAATHCR